MNSKMTCPEIPQADPCKHSELQHYCMSAFCIYVKKLSEEPGMNCGYKDGILQFFVMYIFN